MSERVAIVTGASSGIGLEISQALAANGDHVVMADINPEAGQREADNIDGFFLKADLSKRGDCRQLIDATLEKFGRVDILINNAGIQHVSPIDAFPEDKWDFIIALMLTAPFLLTRELLPHIEAIVARLDGLQTAADLFTGTTRVARALKQRGMAVV